MKAILLFLFLFNLFLLADEKPKGQEIIENLDKSLVLSDGLTRARLSIKKGNHETHFWKVNIFKKEEDVLYTFEVTHYKPVAKILSIKRGQKIIYHNFLSGKFFQIEQMDKLERVLHTSFSYLDLSYSSYETNYKPTDFDKSNIESTNSTTVRMTPFSQYSYQYIDLFVDNSYSPQKLDFTSKEGFLIKTMKLKYGKVKLKEQKSISEISTLKKIEMIDNNTSFISTLEFIEIDKDTNPDKILYEMKTMYEK